MRRAAIALLALAISGCFTYRWKATKAGQGSMLGPVVVEDSGLALKFVTSEPYQFTIRNQSDRVVYVSPQRSVLEVDGVSYPLASGDSRVMHADLQQPDIPIAPGTVAIIGLYPANSLTIKEGQRLRFLVAAHDGSAEPRHIEIGLTAPTPPLANEFTTRATGGDQVACVLTAIIYGGWCWFVSPGDIGAKEAESLAAKVYGPGARVEYVGRE